MKDWLAIGFVTLVYLAFLSLCSVLLIQRVDFVRSAEPGSATVTVAEYETYYDAASNRSDRRFILEGSYTFEGETYESSLFDGWILLKKPAEGDEVPLLINVKNPEEARLWRGWKDAGAFFALPLLLVLLPTAGFISLGKRIRLW